VVEGNNQNQAQDFGEIGELTERVLATKEDIDDDTD